MQNFYVRSKEFVTYLLLRQTTSWRWPPSFATYLLKRLKKLSNNSGHHDLWSQLHPEQHASAPVLCVGDFCIRILSSVPIRRFGTVRSGDRTDHGIPDTWKLLSSLINTLHITGIRCQWRGFDMAQYHLFLGVQALPPTNHRRAKVRSEKCRSALRHSV
jgi:hypothetical protein